MKVAGYVLMCQLALGLALPLSEPMKYQEVMMKVLEQKDIECPEPYTPDCENMRECTLQADPYGCPTGTFCMAENIVMSDGTECPTHCPKHDCEQNQVYCVGGHENGTGCPKEDYCLDKYDKNGYEQECDKACLPEQVQCTTRIYDENGTPQPLACVENVNDCPTNYAGTVYDSDGCKVHEEVHCDGGKLCHGNFCSENCRNPDVCISSDNLVDENGCEAVCPYGGCQLYEFECDFTYDNLGCKVAKECVNHPSQCPKTEFEAETGCPVIEVTCEETELLCNSAKKTLKELYVAMGNDLPEGADENQVCDGQKTCVPKVTESARGIKCEIEECPTPYECPEGQELCNMGYEELTGCPLPKKCLEECEAVTKDDRGCEILDNVTCQDDETKCDPIYDQNGCQEAPQCIPNDGSCNCPEEKYDENGCEVALAHGNEPDNLECGELLTLCFMGLDPETGCGRGYKCIEKQCKDYPGCEISCPTWCNMDKRICRQPDKDDCPQADACQDLTYVNEREEVYGGDVTCENHCAAICPTGEVKCPDTYDENGCKKPEVCVADVSSCPKNQFNENGCELFEASCKPDTEKECDGGFDERNCPKKKTCQQKDEDCPVVCEFEEMLCDFGKATFPHIEGAVEITQVCVPKKVQGGIDAEQECDNVCPPDCDWISQKAVFGGYDPTTGCKLQDKCISKTADYHETLDALRECQ